MSNPSYSRMRRVNSILRQVIAEELEVLKDPRLEMVTVTGVETAPNLRHAVVYFSTLDLDDAEVVQTALETAAPRLRRAVGSQVRMKYTPALSFELDQGVASGERIEALLRRIAQEGETDG